MPRVLRHYIILENSYDRALTPGQKVPGTNPIDGLGFETQLHYEALQDIWVK